MRTGTSGKSAESTECAASDGIDGRQQVQSMSCALCACRAKRCVVETAVSRAHQRDRCELVASLTGAASAGKCTRHVSSQISGTCKTATWDEMSFESLHRSLLREGVKHVRKDLWPRLRDAAKEGEEQDSARSGCAAALRAAVAAKMACVLATQTTGTTCRVGICEGRDGWRIMRGGSGWLRCRPSKRLKGCGKCCAKPIIRRLAEMVR